MRYLSSFKSIVTCFVVVVSCIQVAWGQAMERKIMVMDTSFYYATIDEELQLATLHQGNVRRSLKDTKNWSLPAGRNYNDPIIPFCWDIANKNVFAVNFITNAMNSRSKALKFFPLSSLQVAQNTNMQALLEMSFEQNSFTNFEPYDEVTDQSDTLENFFFDGVALSDTTVCMVISNRKQLSIWYFENRKWQHSPMINIGIENYFSLFTHGGNVYMILNNGSVYLVSLKGIKELPEKRISSSLQEIVLLINKKNNTVKFIERKQLNDALPFNECMQRNAVSLF